MSATDQTADEMFNSLTGFDEIAIKKEFRSDVYALGKEDKAAFMRALIFTGHRRGGAKDSEAYKAAMDLPQSEVVDYFAAEPDGDAEGDDLGEA